MLYQLSYLGVSLEAKGPSSGRFIVGSDGPVHCFAFGFAWRGHAIVDTEACPARPGGEAGRFSRKKSGRPRKILNDKA